MPYAISNPQHGKPVAWRLIDSAAHVREGEIFIEDMPLDFPVWDQRKRMVVSGRPADGVARTLSAEEREEKYAELGAAARYECEKLFPYAGPWGALMIALLTPGDPLLVEAKEVALKFYRLSARIKGASSAAELKDVQW